MFPRIAEASNEFKLALFLDISLGTNNKGRLVSSS